MNTVLDDIAQVIGFTATIKLVVWFGGRRTNIYVPRIAEEGQLLPKIVGLRAAQLLSLEWPGKHLNVPLMGNYATELRRREVQRGVQAGEHDRAIAERLGMSDRRVKQIKDDLRSAGLLLDDLGLDLAVPPPGPESGAAGAAPAPAPAPAASVRVDQVVRVHTSGKHQGKARAARAPGR